jgi:hypothetical protein
MSEFSEFDVSVDELYERAKRNLQSINAQSERAPTITVSIDSYPKVREFLVQRGWIVNMTGKMPSQETFHENHSTIIFRQLLTWHEWCVMQAGDKWFVLANELPPEDDERR